MECLLSLYPASYFLLPLADEPWTVFADISIEFNKYRRSKSKDQSDDETSRIVLCATSIFQEPQDNHHQGIRMTS